MPDEEIYGLYSTTSSTHGDTPALNNELMEMVLLDELVLLNPDIAHVLNQAELSITLKETGFVVTIDRGPYRQIEYERPQENH